MLALSQKPKLPSFPQETIDDWKPRIFSLEFFVVLLVVFVTSGCLNGFLYGRTDGELIISGTQGGFPNIIRQLILLPSYFIGFIYLLQRTGATSRLLKNSFALTLSFLLILTSAFWSLDASDTVRRSLNLLLSSCFGLYLALRYSPPKLVELLARCYLVICVFSVIVILLNPTVAIHHDEHYPALRAYFIHKNSLGLFMGMGAFLAFILTRVRGSRKLGFWLLAFALSLAIASLSRTTWINMIVMASIFFSLTFWRNHKIVGKSLLVFIVSLIGLTIAVIGLDEIMAVLGSSLGRNVTTLTGRTYIWNGVIDAVSGDRFWLGYGYNSFWTSPRGALSQYWGELIGIPTHAHNGWLQTMLHTGIFGAILITLAILKTSINTLRQALIEIDMRYAFGFIFLIFFLIENAAETLFFANDDLVWILFVYFAYYTKIKQEPVKTPHPAFLLNKGKNNAR